MKKNVNSKYLIIYLLDNVFYSINLYLNLPYYKKGDFYNKFFIFKNLF